MSRTDKDRPYWVRANDSLDKQHVPVEHTHVWREEYLECDEHRPVDGRDHANTWCAPSVSYRNKKPASWRKRNRRRWHTKDRQAQNSITRDMVYGARSDWLDDAEDAIDNRKTRLGVLYKRYDWTW